MQAQYELPSWQDALDRCNKFQQLKPENQKGRVKALALLWLAFQHRYASEIAEFPLFIRPRLTAGDKGLLERLLHEIPHAPERAWLIEGDAGMGKTTFCQYLCQVYWKMYFDGLQERIPLYVYLLDVNEHSAQNYVCAALSRQYEGIRQQLLPAGITLDESDMAWLMQQPLLLILDGFDLVRAPAVCEQEVSRWIFLMTSGS